MFATVVQYACFRQELQDLPIPAYAADSNSLCTGSECRIPDLWSVHTIINVRSSICMSILDRCVSFILCVLCWFASGMNSAIMTYVLAPVVSLWPDFFEWCF